MLEALDVWGRPFVKALDSADAYAIWLSQTPRDIALTLAMSSVTGDIRNGGFDQCFWNSFGTAAPEALVVLRSVGLQKYADLLEICIERFGPVFPRERSVRMAALDSGSVTVEDLDDELEPIEAFSESTERLLNQFAAATIRRHRA
jgi:hypothetical protein